MHTYHIKEKNISVTSENFLAPLNYPSIPYTSPIPIPRQSLFCFLSVYIILYFLEYYTNKIKHTLSFWGVWLLPLSILILSIPLHAPTVHYCFVYPLTCQWTFGLSPHLAYYKQSFYKQSYKSFGMDIYFDLFWKNT